MLADAWTILVLTLLETVLGVDNLIFISLAVDKVPKHLRNIVCRIGLVLALLMRFIILFFTSHVLSMQEPIFYMASFSFSQKDLLIIIGGLFLIYKSCMELLNDIFHAHKQRKTDTRSRLSLVVLQIICIDMVFSIDSLLAAIALTHNIFIIAIAFTLSMLEMLFLSNYIAKLVHKLKIVALLFIIFIGIYLILDGLHIELPKGYLYFSFAFALLVECVKNAKEYNKK